MEELIKPWIIYGIQLQLWTSDPSGEKPKRPEYIKLDGKEWLPIKRILSTGTGKVTVTLRSVGFDNEERDIEL